MNRRYAPRAALTLLSFLAPFGGASGSSAAEQAQPAPAGASVDIEAGEDAVILDDTLTIEIASSTEGRVRRV